LIFAFHAFCVPIHSEMSLFPLPLILVQDVFKVLLDKFCMLKPFYRILDFKIGRVY
jgi:hypothetical protein